MGKAIKLLSSKYFILLLYFSLGIPLLFFYRHYFDCSDTFMYLSIARELAEGHLHDAINVIYGPFMPVLLIPFIKFNIDGILSIKIIELIIGAVALLNLSQLTSKFITNKIIGTVLKIAFIPVVLDFAVVYISSDLLFLSLFLIYLNCLLNDFNFKERNTTLKIGTIGGLLFLAKTFGLYLFLVHIVLFFIGRYIKSKQTKTSFSFKPLLVALLVFFSICGVWTAILSTKYNTYTIISYGNYVKKALGPEYFPEQEQIIHHPTQYEGLFKPANPSSFNVMEDPSVIPMKEWSPLASTAEFKHYISIVKRNVFSLYYHEYRRQTGVLLLVLFLLFLFFVTKPFNELPKEFYLLLFTYLLYTAAISALFFLPRYTWLNLFLLVFMMAQIAENFDRTLDNKMGYIFLAIALVLFLKRPIKELILLEDKELHTNENYSALLHPINTIKQNMKPYDDHYSLIEKIKEQKDFKGRIASHQYGKTSQYVSMYCYYLRLPYYGELTNEIIRKEGYQQLKQYDINFYIDEDITTEGHLFFEHQQPYFKDTITGLRIYKLNSNSPQ